MKKRVNIYLPDIVGKGYGSFWHDKHRYRVVKGGRGSKKSKTAALWYIYHMMKHPLANTLVVRKTGNTHKDSTFAELKWAAQRLHVYHLWDFKVNPMECVYRPTGQKILFRGFDDPLKITSITVSVGVLCWVWVEEAFELDDEAEFDTLDETIRGEMPEGLWKQITLTFNPWIDSHWTKTRFFDNEDPNAFTLTTTYKCNEWLDEQDRKKIADLEFSNPDRFKVVGLGEYGLPGGVYFEEFRRDIHTIKPFAIPSEWRRFRALDYGFDMLAVGWFAVDPQSRVYLYRELYEPGLTLKRAAARILELTGADEKIDYTVISPDLWARNRDTGVPEVETLVNAGLKDVQRADNRRIPGWRHLREYLSVYDLPADGGEPVKCADFRIFDTCKNAIRTLASITKDEKDPEDCASEPHEVTHMPEAIRYGMMSRPQPKRTPTDEGIPPSRKASDIRKRAAMYQERETEEYIW
jgi:phage terminase large subunit